MRFWFPADAATDCVAVVPGSYDIRIITGGKAAINVEGFTLAAQLVADVIACGPSEPSDESSDLGLLIATN